MIGLLLFLLALLDLKHREVKNLSKVTQRMRAIQGLDEETRAQRGKALFKPLRRQS